MKALEFTATGSVELQSHFAAEPVTGATGGRAKQGSFDELVGLSGSGINRDPESSDRMLTEHLLPVATSDPNAAADGVAQSGFGRASLAHRPLPALMRLDGWSDANPNTDTSANIEIGQIAGALPFQAEPREAQTMSLDLSGSRLSTTAHELPRIGNLKPAAEWTETELAQRTLQPGWNLDLPDQDRQPQETSERQIADRTDVAADNKSAMLELTSMDCGRSTDVAYAEVDADLVSSIAPAADRTTTADRTATPAPPEQAARNTTPIPERVQPRGGIVDDAPASHVHQYREPKIGTGGSGETGNLDLPQAPVVPRRSVEDLSARGEPSRQMEASGNGPTQGGDTIRRSRAVLQAHIEISRSTEPPLVTRVGNEPPKQTGQRRLRYEEHGSDIGSAVTNDREKKVDGLARSSVVGDARTVATVSSTPMVSVASSGTSWRLVENRAPAIIAWRSIAPAGPVGPLKEHSEVASGHRAAHNSLVMRSVQAMFRREEAAGETNNLATPANPQENLDAMSISPDSKELNDSRRSASEAPDPGSTTLFMQVAAAIREVLPASQAVAAALSSATYAQDLESSQFGIHQLSIEIETADLGKVSVNLDRRGDKVSIELSTDGQDTADIVSNGLSALTEALKLEGLDVQSITVQAAQLRHDDRPEPATMHQPSFAQARGDSQSGQDRTQHNASDRGHWQAKTSLAIQAGGDAPDVEAMPPRRLGRSLVI